MDFRRNFRSLVDLLKSPLVALLETKMKDYLLLLNDFPFNRIIEVPTVGNAGGLAVMWDDTLLDLDEIATMDQEIYAMIKIRKKMTPSYLVVFILVLTDAREGCHGKILKTSRINTQVSG